jgi:Transglycosylase SLT domain
MPQKTVKTPVGDAPVVPLFLIGTGMYLAWFGVHYWRSDVKYPTDPVKAVLQGKPLPSAKGTPTADETAVLKAAKEEAAIAAASPSGQPSGTGTVPGSTTIAGRGSGSASRTQNQQIVQLVASGYGWGSGQQWTCLVNVLNAESGFDNTAQNPTSTAYGMFQFLDSTWAGVGGTKTSDPTKQAQYGCAYIKARYGTPCAAWAHEQQYNWY